MLYRDGVYYYVRRVPHDLTSLYDLKRLCFSLKTKSASAAVRVSKSINQRLEDYWLGLRLQNMDIPAIQVVRASDAADDATLCLAAKFRDWCIEKIMGIKTVKLVFASVRAIINLAIPEEGFDCSNVFAKTYFPNDDSSDSRQPIGMI